MTTLVMAEPDQARTPVPDATPLAETNTAEQPSFPIWEFQIIGNTVLDRKLVEQEVHPYFGEDRTVKDVDAASKAVQELYRRNGYPTVLVNIPQQDVSSGIVRLEIIEGKIDRLRITGSRFFSLDEMRAMVPSLSRGIVPHLPTVQEELLSVNTRSSDLRVTPIFRPGRTPGTVSVELRVRDDSPFHGSLEVNGRNSNGTTRTRLIGNLSYANLWLKNHTGSLTYQTSPEDTREVRVLVGSYTIPFEDSNDRLAMYAVRSDSETGVASGGAIAVVGTGKILGGRYVVPLDPQADYFHSMVFGVDYKKFDEEIALIDAGSVITPISYTTFSLEYNATTITDSGKRVVSAGIKLAPRALGNESEEFLNKRFKANPNFSIINASYQQEMRLGGGIKLNVSLAGQLANEPLISNEQFSVGGAKTVRGYFESQLLADDAVRASLDVQGPDLTWLTGMGFDDAYVYGFIDAAATRIYQPLPGTGSHDNISSVGFGMRLASGKNFEMDLDAASPVQDNNTVEKGDVRVHFRVRAAF